ncbi:MAG: hypothetical protein ACOX7N_00265 [Lawsonibacter sp.]|jgi:hypothetical protein
MKKRRLVLGLTALLLIGVVWWWTGPRYALDGPPILTVSAGDEEVAVGCWSSNWTSPTATFSACGDVPTVPFARSYQPVVYVQKGAQDLKLSYPVAPSHVTVSCTPDSGGEIVCLYDGWGKRKLSIPLPKDFRGIYEISERWRTVPPATGDTQRGFLVVGEGESVGDPKLEKPPALTVAGTDGTMVIARLGSYSWFVWLGGDEMEGTISDSPHPLEIPDLPHLPAQPGDRMELQFAIPPNKLSLWAWTVRGGVEQEPTEVDILPGGDDWLVPEGGGETVYEVRGSWYLAGNTWCDVSYLFAIP